MSIETSGAGAPEKTADNVKSKAIEVQAAVKTEATDTVEAAKLKGKEMARKTEATVRDAFEETKSSMCRVADKRREQVAGKVSDYQRAAKAAASKLKEQDDDTLGEHLENLSAKLGDVSDYLSNNRVDALTRDAGRFTRKNPELMLGATVLIGFAVARFLKTSAHSSNESDRRSESDRRLPGRPAELDSKGYRTVSIPKPFSTPS